MAAKVLIVEKLLASCEQAIIEKLNGVRLYEQEDPEAFLKQHGKEFPAIAGFAVPRELIEALPNLRLIANFGVGYDGVDIRAAKAQSIAVTNTPDVLNEAMAEITLGLMVSLARRLPQADRYVREGRWPQGSFPLQNQLTGKTVGIVGLGRIGKEIAELCQAFKMRVVYFGRNKQAGIPYVYYDNLVDMAEDADWLVVVTPGGAATKNLVDKEVLQALGPQGFLVNVARGSVVEEKALIELLQNGGLAGAALDVFADEPNVPQDLLALENVVLSPHQGSATHQTRFAMGALVVANLEAFFAGEPLLTQVV